MRSADDEELTLAIVGSMGRHKLAPLGAAPQAGLLLGAGLAECFSES
jgi:hypothetical protein